MLSPYTCMGQPCRQGHVTNETGEWRYMFVCVCVPKKRWLETIMILFQSFFSNLNVGVLPSSSVWFGDLCLVCFFWVNCENKSWNPLIHYTVHHCVNKWFINSLPSIEESSWQCRTIILTTWVFHFLILFFLGVIRTETVHVFCLICFQLWSRKKSEAPWPFLLELVAKL